MRSTYNEYFERTLVQDYGTVMKKTDKTEKKHFFNPIQDGLFWVYSWMGAGEKWPFYLKYLAPRCSGYHYFIKQILHTACRRFTMVRISDNGPGWK